MHGVPKDLDLSIFRGKTLTLVGIGEHAVYFHFHPEGLLSVEGTWEVLSSEGTVIDQSMEHADRSEYRVHRLLSHDVVGSELDPPSSFSLRFSNGYVLRVFDDSEQYESFSIQPGDIYV